MNYLHTETRESYQPLWLAPTVYMTGKGTNNNGIGETYNDVGIPMRRDPIRDFYEEREIQPKGNRRKEWNRFSHYTYEARFPFTPTQYVYSDNTGFGAWRRVYQYNDNFVGWTAQYGADPGNPFNGVPLLYNKNVNTGEFIQLHPDIANMINRSVRSMLGQIRPNLSLINTIIELKDFRRLPVQLKKMKRTLGYLRKNIPKIVDSFRSTSRNTKRSLLQILGLASDLLLQSEFNVRPLVNDLYSIQSSIKQLRGEVIKRLQNEGKRRRRDYHIDLSAYYRDDHNVAPLIGIRNGPASGIRPRYFFGSVEAKRSVVYSKASFHAQIEYSTYYTEFQRENAKILLLLDYLGVQFDPSIIWNAIPWTFAIDWVVNVNSWLSQFAKANMEPKTIVHRFLWSQHVRRTTYLSYRAHISSTKSPKYTTPQRYVSVINEDAYKRDSSMLNVIAGLETSGLNPKEFILGSALGFSRGY